MWMGVEVAVGVYDPHNSLGIGMVYAWHAHGIHAWHPVLSQSGTSRSHPRKRM